MTGITTTIASVRGSRRIWMNSLRTIDQTRLSIGLADEGDVDRQAGLQLAARVWQTHLDREDELAPVAPGLDVAGRELGAGRDRLDLAGERAAGEGVRARLDRLPDRDPPQLGLRHVDRQGQLVEPRDGQHRRAGADDLALACHPLEDDPAQR